MLDGWKGNASTVVDDVLDNLRERIGNGLLRRQAKASQKRREEAQALRRARAEARASELSDDAC